MSKKIKKTREEIQKEREVQRTEMLKRRSDIKTFILDSKIQRDKTLSELAKQENDIKNSKGVLKAKLKQQVIQEKLLIEQERADDAAELKEQRKAIIEKGREIKRNKIVVKKGKSQVKKDIKQEKIRQKNEKARRIVEAKNKLTDQREQNKIRLHQIELEAKDSKNLLIKEKKEKKAEGKRVKLQAKQDIAKEKVSIIAEREKLKELRKAKEAVIRSEKIKEKENAKLEKAEIKLKKIKANEDYKKEIISAKGKKVKNAQEEVIALKKQNQEYRDKLSEINGEISDNKKLIKETRKETKTLLEEVVPEQDNGALLNYGADKNFEEFETPFDEEGKAIDLFERNSKIIGATVKKFGRKTTKKFRQVQKPAIESDIRKFKKKKAMYEDIKRFREEAPNAIRVETFGAYVEMVLGKQISDESVGRFHAHAISAILSKRSIKFADGFIFMTQASKKNIVKFVKEQVGKIPLVELYDKEAGDEINILISKKLDAGAKILLANGLMVIKEENTIKFLRDTNFMKA